jgi:hypothetical protein
MIIPVAIMIAGVSISWIVLTRHSGKPATPQAALRDIDLQALSGCVLVLCCLFPAILLCNMEQSLRSQKLAGLLAVEAASCVVMALARGTARHRVIEQRISSYLSARLGAEIQVAICPFGN